MCSTIFSHTDRVDSAKTRAKCLEMALRCLIRNARMRRA
jgi:hypothetical protein